MRITDEQHLQEFCAWLGSCGAEVLTVVDEGEIIRVVVRGHTLIATGGLRGSQFWPQPLAELYGLFLGGSYSPRLAQLQKVRKLTSSTRRSRVQALARRDGWQCWYCRVGIRPSWSDGPAQRPVATIEEICPRQIGGPSHIHNQVLACGACNEAAANLPVVEKVAMRERLQVKGIEAARRNGAASMWAPDDGDIVTEANSS